MIVQLSVSLNRIERTLRTRELTRIEAGYPRLSVSLNRIEQTLPHPWSLNMRYRCDLSVSLNRIERTLRYISCSACRTATAIFQYPLIGSNGRCRDGLAPAPAAGQDFQYPLIGSNGRCGATMTLVTVVITLSVSLNRIERTLPPWNAPRFCSLKLSVSLNRIERTLQP